MARAIWTGALSFGLVNVPVELFAATEDKTVHFNQFQAGTSDRIRNKRVNERTGEEVEYSDIVKGYELDSGEYVIVEPEELEAVEPGRTRTIEITDFVDLAEIDPIYYKKAYYLAPRGEEARRAYALLRQAMTGTNKVGVATFVLRGKQHLVAVRPGSEVLVLETMFFADEVRDARIEIPGTALDLSFEGRELDTAELLVDSMSAPWDPENYRDTYRERVEELIAAKRKGEVVVTERPSGDHAKVVDLMEALRASVEAARQHHPGNRDVPPLVEASAATATAHASRGPAPARAPKAPRATRPAKSAKAAKAATPSKAAKAATPPRAGKAATAARAAKSAKAAKERGAAKAAPVASRRKVS